MSEKVKYLGHIICCDLSDDEDMMRQRRHLYYAQGNLKVFLCVRSRYFVPFVRPCILVTCGGTIRHRAFIS